MKKGKEGTLQDKNVMALLASQSFEKTKMPDWFWANMSDSVWAKMPDWFWAKMPDSVWANMPDSVWAKMPDSVWANMPDSFWANMPDSVWANMPDSFWANMPDSFWANMPDSVWANMPDSVWANMPDSFWAKMPDWFWANMPDSFWANMPDSVWAKMPDSFWAKMPDWFWANMPDSFWANMPDSFWAKMPDRKKDWDSIPILQSPYTHLFKDIQDKKRLFNQSTFGEIGKSIEFTTELNVCNTPMCTAGNLCHMAAKVSGKLIYDLVKKYGYARVATMIARKSHPDYPIQNYGNIPNDWALAFIEISAEREAAEESK